MLCSSNLTVFRDFFTSLMDDLRSVARFPSFTPSILASAEFAITRARLVSVPASAWKLSGVRPVILALVSVQPH